jgi:hypothetical protein
VTATPSGVRPEPPPRDLAARLFRALYTQFELRSFGGLHIAVQRHAMVRRARSPARSALSRHRARTVIWATSPAAIPMMTMPAPDDAARLTSVLRQHPRWSIFWDKRYAVWRAAEDDPDSVLYAESGDLDTVIGYILAHS